MKTDLKSIKTRFRAYKLSNAGACFSYCADKTFILIEARLPDNKDLIKDEMKIMEVNCLSNLHITSWDQDHCSYNDLEWILKELRPLKIQAPGYIPHTDSGKKCHNLIEKYKKEMTKKVVYMTPDYINSLNKSDEYTYSNVVFHPREITEKSNDNSTIKFFRKGMFNVLSLGDVESEKIGAMLNNSSYYL